MGTQAWAYFLFGLALVMLFGVIIRHYYARERHEKGEEVKHKMLEDDD